MPLEGNVCNSKYQYVIYRLEAHSYFISYNNSLHEDMQINSQSNVTSCASEYFNLQSHHCKPFYW